MLKTDWNKNIWTSVASILLPVCFVSKDDIPNLPDPGKQFHKFYKWNSVLFCILSWISLVGLHLLLYFDIFLQYNCSNLPFLSCQNGSILPKENGEEMCNRLAECDTDNIHFHLLTYGSVAVFVLSFFDTILVWIQNRICPSLRGRSEWFLRPV